MENKPKLTHLTLRGTGGVKLHTLTRGEGKLVLFLHGFPEFGEVWSDQLHYFGRTHLAAAVDLRGYNMSEKPEPVSAYALPQLVEDVRQVIEKLSPVAPIILIGHDWGGIIAWAFARAHPEMLERLVVINAPHPAIFARELSENSNQRFASSYTLLFRSPAVAEEVLSSFDYALLRKTVFGRTAKPEAFSPELRDAYLASWKEPRALRSALNYYSAAQNFAAAREENWQIEVPTLVLWGDADPTLLTGNLRGLEDYVSDIRLHRHPTATHWIVHEEPEWVNSHIENFISGEKYDGRSLMRALAKTE